MSVWQGEVWDVAIDLRRASPTSVRWHGVALSAEDKHQFSCRPASPMGSWSSAAPPASTTSALPVTRRTTSAASDGTTHRAASAGRSTIRSCRRATPPRPMHVELPPIHIFCSSFSGNENGPWSRCISSTRPSALPTPCRMIAATGARPPTGLNHALLRRNRHTLRRLHALNPGGELLSRTHAVEIGGLKGKSAIWR